jgi:hypothetical protein
MNGASGTANELDVYADMDDAKAAEIIKLMVEHKMTLAPTLIRKGAGLHEENERFQAEARSCCPTQTFGLITP